MSDMPPLDPNAPLDIGALLAMMEQSPLGGVDQSAIFTQTLADPTAQVFVGRRPEPRRRRSMLDLLNDPVGTVADAASRRGSVDPLDHLPVPLEMVDTNRSVGDLLQDFYTLDPGELSDIQRLLYAGGWYGDVDILDVPWGQHDETTFSAWAQVVTRAARFNAAGVKKTPTQILEEAVRGRGGMGPGESGADRPVVSLSDPAGLRSTIDAVATNVLGRAATNDEKRMFVGLIHGMQRDSQLRAQQYDGRNDDTGMDDGTSDWDLNGDGTFGADELAEAIAARQSEVQAAAGGGPIEVVQPSPEAQAEEALRAANPTEASAHDVSLQFNQFLNLLKGVV